MRSEGYGSQVVCLSVCHSVTTLAATAIDHGPKVKHHRILYGDFLDFSSRVSRFVQEIRRYLLTSESLDTFCRQKTDQQFFTIQGTIVLSASSTRRQPILHKSFSDCSPS